MNRIERAVYDLVKSQPWIKSGIKKAYQGLWDLKKVPASSSPYHIFRREGAFFGFHDKIPFSPDDKMLLGMQYDIPLGMPAHGEGLRIGIYSGDDYSKYNEISRTLSWNWHQGCQLQWCGSSNEKVIFNDYIKGKNVSRVVSVESKETELIGEQAIATVSANGKWAIGYSFERVNVCMPGYGYSHGECLGVDELAPERDGLYCVDLSTGMASLILSIAEVVSITPDSTMHGAKHFFSHAIISPAGDRVMFLHRWIKGDLRKRWSRMLTCNLDGSSLYVFPTSGMVSHMGWRDSDHILAYCRDANGKDGYVLFRDEVSESWSRVGDGHYSSDGHPSFRNDGRWILTDTYPDKTRRSYLTIFDCLENKRYNIAYLKHWKRFASPSPQQHWACDLHPRWNRKGDVLCFDSVYSGKRSLCTIHIPEISNGRKPKTI